MSDNVYRELQEANLEGLVFQKPYQLREHERYQMYRELREAKLELPEGQP